MDLSKPIRIVGLLVAAGTHFCDIQSIQPVDYPRMQRALRQNLAGASQKTPASHLRG